MKLRASIIELALRQCVFVILNIYAISKLFGGQFYRKGDLPQQVAETTLGEVSSFTIAWAFMGHSYGYILFIGLSQLLGAWLLLWQKTKFIGILMLLPIMVNIVLFDLLFLDVYPALINAIACLFMLLTILYLNKTIVASILTIMVQKSPFPFPAKSKFIALLICILGIASLFLIDSAIEFWLGASKEKITGP